MVEECIVKSEEHRHPDSDSSISDVFGDEYVTSEDQLYSSEATDTGDDHDASSVNIPEPGIVSEIEESEIEAISSKFGENQSETGSQVSILDSDWETEEESSEGHSGYSDQIQSESEFVISNFDGQHSNDKENSESDSQYFGFSEVENSQGEVEVNNPVASYDNVLDIKKNEFLESAETNFKELLSRHDSLLKVYVKNRTGHFSELITSESSEESGSESGEESGSESGEESGSEYSEESGSESSEESGESGEESSESGEESSESTKNSGESRKRKGIASELVEECSSRLNQQSANESGRKPHSFCTGVTLLELPVNIESNPAFKGYLWQFYERIATRNLKNINTLQDKLRHSVVLGNVPVSREILERMYFNEWHSYLRMSIIVAKAFNVSLSPCIHKTKDRLEAYLQSRSSNKSSSN